jgi:hypothetical protein
MLLKRVFEVDPLNCPERGGKMKIISSSNDALVPDPEFFGSQRLESNRGPLQSRELQLVLNPEYL